MKAGFAVCDITPPLGLYLTGYGDPRRVAESIHTPLEASVMVLEEGEKRAAVIGLDWCFADGELVDRIRKGVREKTGIEEKHILIACSHTHSAPHTSFVKVLGRTDADPEEKGLKYALAMIPLIADCVKEAAAKLRECKLGIGHTHTKAGVSRRGTDENGKVTSFREDPWEICDSNMTLGYFRDAENGEDLGIFLHASGHNTAMGGTRAISSDWCGVMKHRIRAKYPTPIVFVNGALGDMGPRTNLWPESNPGLQGFSAGGGDGEISAAEVGLRGASDALRALEGIRDFRKDIPLSIHVGALHLPQDLAMKEEEAKAILAQYKDAPEEGKEPPTDYYVAKTVFEAYQKPLEEELVIEQTLIAFGSIALTPLPFEPFSRLSLRLRKYGPFEHTLLCGNVNGLYAYMPDRGSFAMGGYEVTCLKTVRPYVIRPEAGDQAISQSLAALRLLAEEKP